MTIPIERPCHNLGVVPCIHFDISKAYICSHLQESFSCSASNLGVTLCPALAVVSRAASGAMSGPLRSQAPSRAPAARRSDRQTAPGWQRRPSPRAAPWPPSALRNGSNHALEACVEWPDIVYYFTIHQRCEQRCTRLQLDGRDVWQGCRHQCCSDCVSVEDSCRLLPAYGYFLKST